MSSSKNYLHHCCKTSITSYCLVPFRFSQASMYLYLIFSISLLRTVSLILGPGFYIKVIHAMMVDQES